MEDELHKRLYQHNLNYKLSLDRIIDKYSKLHNQDEGVEVDLDRVNISTLQNYMTLSKKKLNKLHSKSLVDLREESLMAQDITRETRLDIMHQDGGPDKSADSTSQFSVQDIGVTRNDVTQLTVSSLDESQRNLCEVDLQPEDQDEELQTSLSSHGSSLVDLYPSMISRIERAWHRQDVSMAADAVLRRYRRWRRQPNRSHLNNTFVVPVRHPSSNPKTMSNDVQVQENYSSPAKRQLMKIETTPRSHLQVVTSLHDQWAQQQSSVKERASIKREQPRPVLVMDLSGPSESCNPKEISLNKTFNMSESSPHKLSQLEEQSTTYTVSPLRSCYMTAKESVNPSLMFKKLSSYAHSVQTAVCSTYTSENRVLKERPDICGSLVRQSPLKEKIIPNLSRLPQTLCRSPKEHSARPRSLSATMSSPSQKLAVPLMKFYPPNSHQSVQLCSPQSTSAAGGQHKFRRHLSFDSSLPLVPVPLSPKQIDEKFKRLFHKFVCQNKSASSGGTHCRLCARTSEASKGHSSSVVAALALSPHSSIQRKRHRKLDWGNQPQSKRLREEYWTYSPGSKRHSKEMLRRCLYPAEWEPPRGGFSCSSSKHSLLHRFNTQQCPAHQEPWMTQRQLVPAADVYGLGPLQGRGQQLFSKKLVINSEDQA